MILSCDARGRQKAVSPNKPENHENIRQSLYATVGVHPINYMRYLLPCCVLFVFDYFTPLSDDTGILKDI